MAALLFDSILNETIQNFRGHQLLESSLGPAGLKLEAASMQQAASNSGQLVGLTEAMANQSGGNLSAQMQTFDQIDRLTSLDMVEVIGGKERVFWVILFLSMVFVAAGGNLLVIYVVATNKEMKSVTNYFLVNLSLADTMVSTLNVIFNFTSMLDSHWPFGSVYCKISNFIAILSIAASVFTLTAISCDRYTAIIHPLRPRMSHRSAIGWILLIWTLSTALSLPNLIYSDIISDGNVSLICSIVWPDGRYPVSSYDHVYNIMILVFTYLVPILTMAILYYKVGRELWGYEAIGEDVEKQRRALKAKKKIVKMMIVVVIMFALCWLPYHAFFVANYYWPTFQDAPMLYQRCYLIMYWLAMSNSMYNPIIIYFMNSKFRHEFKRVLYFIFCCKTLQPQTSARKVPTTATTVAAPTAARQRLPSNDVMAGPRAALAAKGAHPPSQRLGLAGNGPSSWRGATLEEQQLQLDPNGDVEAQARPPNSLAEPRRAPPDEQLERQPFLQTNSRMGPAPVVCRPTHTSGELVEPNGKAPLGDLLDEKVWI